MPPVSIPYARERPYDNSQYVRAMADLMLKRGDVAAAAALQRGQNTQQMYDRLGNITMATFAGIGQQRDEERDRAIRQATLDREYAMKQQEMQQRAEERAAEQAYRRRQEEAAAETRRENVAETFTANTPVGTVVQEDIYRPRIANTGSAAAYQEQRGMPERLPAKPLIETMGIPSYTEPMTSPGGIPRYETLESPTPMYTTPRAPVTGGGEADLQFPQRMTMSRDTAAVPGGFKRIATQPELVQLENLRRQAEAAERLAADRREDNQRALDAAAATAAYRDAQLKLADRRAAAAEKSTGTAGEQIIQTPNGWAIVDKRTGQTRPVLGQGNQPLERYGDTSALGPYRDAFDFAISKVSPTKRTPYIATAERLMAEDNKPALVEYIKKTVLDNVGVDQQNKVAGRAGAIAAMTNAKQLLTEMQAQGVPTGWLTGTAEDLYRRLGSSQNPKYVEMGTQLGVALANYRRAITGAAFSESEGKDYYQQWPNYSTEFPVNMAKITGLLNAFEIEDKSFWRMQLGPSADTLFGGAATAKPQNGWFDQHKPK